MTGFMGSGKSTVAPRLARGLGYEAIDLDDEITRRTGMSIPAIFELYGETRFRKEESEMLRQTGERSNIVVSLGGGAVLNPDNLAWCRQNGTLIYLCASAAFLASRLAVSKRERPLLFDDLGQPLSMDALKKRVSGLLDERRAVYEQAHITVVVDAVSVSNIIKAIREEMAADR